MVRVLEAATLDLHVARQAERATELRVHLQARAQQLHLPDVHPRDLVLAVAPAELVRPDLAPRGSVQRHEQNVANTAKCVSEDRTMAFMLY